MGCDGLNRCSTYNSVQFQSTHPSWGATLLMFHLPLKQTISIHAPIVGCDQVGGICKCQRTKISIHAPIVGCDSAIRTLPSKMLDFNPRTHRGVRQDMQLRIYNRDMISIHAPIVGCDRMLLYLPI
mgnify:CR=1 FL=1